MLPGPLADGKPEGLDAVWTGLAVCTVFDGCIWASRDAYGLVEPVKALAAAS